MKLLLLLALVGLAASASLRPLSEMSSTTPTLVYQYDTQVATGMEEVSNQFSTVRVRCQVLMKPEEASGIAAGVRRWRIQFRTCEFRQRNNVTESPMPKNLLPMEQLRNLETEQVEATLSQMLSRPFKVDISENQQVIRKVQFGGRDPFWSVNIKKGFLSLLQLNFVPQESDSSEVMAKGQWEKEIDEATVAAVCRTQYSAKRVRFHDFDEQLFRVSKAIDFNNCINPLDGRSGLPGVFFGLTHSQLLEPLNDQPLPQLQTNNQGEFLVQRNPSNGKMLVKRASTKTIYTLAPFAKSWHGTRKTWAIQKLELKGVSDEAPAGSGTEMQEKPEGLRLIFPGEDRQIMGDSLRMSAVGLLMNQLLDENNNVKIVNYEEILTFLRLHVSDEESLREIAKELEEPNRSRHLRIPGVDQLNAAKKKKLLKIFVADLCPQIGSQGSIQFLMNFTHQVMRPVTAQNFVKRVNMQLSEIGPIFIKLGLQSKVQLQSIKLILQTINSDFIRERMVSPKNMPIYTSMWLSLGAMVNVYYSRQGGVEPYVMAENHASSSFGKAEYIRKVFQQPWEVRRQHARQSEQFRNQFIREIRRLLRQSDLMKTLALKVTKNCGLFELYNDMRTIFTQKWRDSVNQRVQAVYATQHMLQRHTLPRTISEDPREVLNQQKFVRDHQEFIRHFDKLSRQIQTELLTCFKNPREDPEIRIACYRVLIQSPIKQTVLNSLVQAIMSDVTQQVHAYCVQHMMQIADRPLPRYYRVVKTVRAFVSTIQRDQPATESYSRVLMAQIADQLHKMGLTFETDMIISDKSFTPRWTHLRIDQQMMGRNVPLMEISVRTQGLQQLLEKAFGPRGLIVEAQSVTKILKRVARETMISWIKSEDKVKFAPRISKEFPDIELNIGLMGYDTTSMMYSSMNSGQPGSFRIIKFELMKNSLNQMAQVFKTFVKFSTVSSSFLMPTTVGTMLDMACMINIQSEPKINFQKQEMTDTKSKMQIDAELPVKVQIVSKMGNNMHVLQHSQYYVSKAQVANGFQPKIGVEIQHQESGDFSVSLLQWRPQAQTKILEISNKAFCAVKEISQNAESGPLAFNTVLKEALKPKMVALPTRLNYQPAVNDILDTFFGTRLRIKADFYSNKDIFEAPCALLMAPGKLEIFAGPGSNIAGNSIIRHQVQLSYPIEGLAVPQVQLKVDQVSQDDTDTSIAQMAKVQFTPKEIESGRYPFQIQMQMRNFDSIILNGNVILPTTPWMKPSSVPLVASEWFIERSLLVRMDVRKASSSEKLGDLNVELKTNPQLKQILMNSRMTQMQLLNMFPLLVQCLNESGQSFIATPPTVGRLVTPSCIRQFNVFNELNAVEVQYRPMASEILMSDCRFCKTAIVWVQNALLPYLTSQELLSRRDSPSEVKVQMVPSPVDTRVWHINASCPLMQWQWQSIKLPFAPITWAGIDPVMTRVADYVKGGVAKCVMANSHIRTFDNVIYSIPQRLLSQIVQRNCPIVLARDCSPAKEFEVLTNFQGGKKHVSIRIKLPKSQRSSSRDLKIEFARDDARSSSGYQAKMEVNGREITLPIYSATTNQEITFLNRDIHTPQGIYKFIFSAYKVQKTDGISAMFRIRSVKQQVEFLVGGDDLSIVEIRASPFYNNKMCGLCGDYNLETYREFKGPDMGVRSSRQMVQEYVVPVTASCNFYRSVLNPFSFDNPDRLDNPDWEKFGTFDLVHKPENEFEPPTARPTCMIHNEHVRTFYNTEIDMFTPADAYLFESSPCNLKLASVRFNNSLRAKVYLNWGAKKVIIRAGERTDWHQEISLETPRDTRHTIPYDPPQAAATIDPIDDGTIVTLSRGLERLLIKVTSDRRIVIKPLFMDMTMDVVKTEDSICRLYNNKPLRLDKSNTISFLEKFTDNGEGCSWIRGGFQKCQVVDKHIVPFHRAGMQSRRPLKISSQVLKPALYRSLAPLVLSVDKIRGDSGVYSVFMIYQYAYRIKEPQWEFRLIRNTKELVTVSIESRGTVVTCIKANRNPEIDAPYNITQGLPNRNSLFEMDLAHSFKITMGNGRLVLEHKHALYRVEIDVREHKPMISITRANQHERYSGIGLCEVNNNPEIMNFMSNPRMLIEKVARDSVAAHESAPDSDKVFHEEDVYRIKQLLQNIKKHDLDCFNIPGGDHYRCAERNIPDYEDYADAIFEADQRRQVQAILDSEGRRA